MTTFRSLREFLDLNKQCGELKTFNGIGWDLDMSSIAEIAFAEGREPKPMLLFDEIPGYAKGYRTLFNQMGSPRRLSQILNIAERQVDHLSLLQNWRKKSCEIKRIPPKVISSGLVQANLMVDDRVDLLKFPVPRFHELDGGRYIGTSHAVIQKDPDSGWVNLGTYRVMLVDRNHVTIHVLEGKHGSTIMQKYFDRGQVMPIAIAIGMDPTLWFASSYPGVPFGVSEYDYAGGIKGEPIEVINGQYSGIPFPASAEIVIEGECHPGEMADEGPFGEWCGYYANCGRESVPEPLVRVTAVHYQDNPILSCSLTHVPPNENTLRGAVTKGVAIWNLLESVETPGIRGVWCHEAGAGALFNVISLKQLYAGHAQRAGLIASQFPKDAGGYTVVVDEDIDPLNLKEVIWAMATRAEPERSIHIIPFCRTGSADPRIPISEKKKYKVTPKPLIASRVLINACRPYEYKNEWYPVSRMSPELRQKTVDKWNTILTELCGDK